MPQTNKTKKATQNEQQSVRLNTDQHPYSSADSPQKQIQPRRLSSYFIVLIESGSVTYKLDLKDLEVCDGDLLFAMPNQIFVPPGNTDQLKYYKVLFNENTLALLPQRFPFLVNPLNSQILRLNSATRERVQTIFKILNTLLHTEQGGNDSELVLAYLNLLLSELNTAYFKNEVTTTNTNLSKFVEFKVIVETQLAEQPSIPAIAEKLALTTNGLYRLVKEYAGTSPKDFFTNRLMLEAQRKLRHSKLSVKELAYELGFNDPDYFSRLFKKSTGKSVTDFLQNQDLSGK